MPWFVNGTLGATEASQRWQGISPTVVALPEDAAEQSELRAVAFPAEVRRRRRPD